MVGWTCIFIYNKLNYIYNINLPSIFYTIFNHKILSNVAKPFRRKRGAKSRFYMWNYNHIYI